MEEGDHPLDQADKWQRSLDRRYQEEARADDHEPLDLGWANPAVIGQRRHVGINGREKQFRR